MHLIFFLFSMKLNLISSIQMDEYQNGGNQKMKEIWKQNLLPTKKHSNVSMAYSGVGNIEFINSIMDQLQYTDILKWNLSSSTQKQHVQNGSKFYQNNDPKHYARNIHLWLLYNCPDVIRAPPQSLAFNHNSSIFEKNQKSRI